MYYVIYVENGFQTIKKFKTKKKALDFVTKFEDKWVPGNIHLHRYWIDYIFHGKLIKEFE